jgi:hypothetical protein
MIQTVGPDLLRVCMIQTVGLGLLRVCIIQTVGLGLLRVCMIQTVGLGLFPVCMIQTVGLGLLHVCKIQTVGLGLFCRYSVNWFSLGRETLQSSKEPAFLQSKRKKCYTALCLVPSITSEADQIHVVLIAGLESALFNVMLLLYYIEAETCA